MAISGAHNLGGAAQYNQGFQGTWKPGNEPDGTVSDLTFNNEFYKIMIDPNITWYNIDATQKYNNTNETLTEPRWQWEGYPKYEKLDKPYFMLNTDFYVFFNITVNAYGKATCILDTNCSNDGSCGLFGKCGMSPTYEIALFYSEVNIISKFFRVFKT